MLLYPSKKFAGCFYQFGKRIGKGGSGSVYQVFLKDMKTQHVKKLLAGKIVLESYILNKNTEKRRKNLQREIELLGMADSFSSVTLIELIETEPDHTVIIQDYANGGNLFHLMETRLANSQTLNESEAQNIIALLSQSLNGIYQQNIIHRDLNINNVMLHFPKLEPSVPALQDPDIFEKLD